MPTPEMTHCVSLDQASKIVDAALVRGREANAQPLTVVVLDTGGHVVCCKREDSSGILRFEIAFGKAWGALGMGKPSRYLELVSVQRPVFISTLSGASGGRFIPVPGGVLILGAHEDIIGAVGISGDTSDVDEQCAIAGIHSVGLASDPPEPVVVPR
jgi:uncharacterized protein GlcG (DUF336 family)